MTIEQIIIWYNRELQKRLLIKLGAEDWYHAGVAKSRAELKGKFYVGSR